jgi:hypothetical protein
MKARKTVFVVRDGTVAMEFRFLRMLQDEVWQQRQSGMRDEEED